jgi:prepilin signal peptidase PulO-like enzyme (type II secretory pathway)
MSSAVQSRSTPAPLSLRIGFWACTAIAVAVVVRRVVALGNPGLSPAAPQVAKMDAAFASHTALTLSHILPALGFVLLAPIALAKTSRYSTQAQSLLYPLGAIVGVTAYAMSVFAIGGWVERSAVLFFNTLFLVCLWQSFRSRENALDGRRWLLRAIVILLGIATTRPVMGVFFATSRLTHWEPRQFFGFAFWIGFAINTIAVEAWLRRERA